MAKAERIIRRKFTAAFGAAETTKNISISLEADVGMIMLVVPNFTNVVTTSLDVKDSDNYAVLAKSGVARNTTTKYNGADAFWFSGAGTITLTLSGAPGGSGGTIAVVFYGREMA